ncbi:MAG TPA: DUF4870 domain-containing protein [Xanthomonadales bacterium]|nr:DUF4870 domain-containing protein [Xanthomonadales bacterium]
MLAHLSTLSGLFTGGVGCIVGPLVVWLVKKDTMPFVDDQGKEALNFNITVFLVGIVLTVLTVLSFFILSPLTILLGVAIGIAWLVLTIIALVKANDGVAYRYPFSLRLVK